MPVLLVIVGSTRPGRVGRPVADWFVGQARAQVIDRNWVVVAQTPAAGESVGEMEAILSVVKTDEPNNC